MNNYDVIVVGGGLAGLTAALHISKMGYATLVIENHDYPRHKVCGEYVSAEVEPYLHSLGISLDAGARIHRLEISNHAGKRLETPLQMGGVGISRFFLEDQMYRQCLKQGVEFCFDKVTAVKFNENSYLVACKSNHFQSPIAVGAYGKRSSLDKNLGRQFINNKSGWMAVKAHYDLPDFPNDLVGLHSFPGGYGGLSMTESGAVNFCYLTTYKSFKDHGDIDSFTQEVVATNPILKDFLRDATMNFSDPLSIAQISFGKRELVTAHMLMCGDSAGMIHPLCGNGMAMAIHGAKLASEAIDRFFQSSGFSREKMESDFMHNWATHFSGRMRWGRILQSILMQEHLSQWSFNLLSKNPRILKGLIKTTHGDKILA